MDDYVALLCIAGIEAFEIVVVAWGLILWKS
jgi:hypothetical protein